MNIAFYTVLKEEESITFQKNISIAIKKQLLDFIKLKNIKSDKDEIRKNLLSFIEIYPQANKEIFDFLAWIWEKGNETAIEKVNFNLKKSDFEKQLIEKRTDLLIQDIDETIIDWLFNAIAKSERYGLSSVDIVKYLFETTNSIAQGKSEVAIKDLISEIMNTSEYETYKLNQIKNISWKVVLEEENEKECLENERAGNIKLGNNFPSGHKHPPAKYYCSCFLMPNYE